MSPRFQAEIALENEPEAIRRAQEEVLAAIGRHQYPEAAGFAIRLALEEAIYNAFRHGHKEIPSEPIRISWRIRAEDVLIEVEDKGPGFKPDHIPDPTGEERIELPHGRGVMLMRAYMTTVEYNERGNRVSMVYQRPQP